MKFNSLEKGNDLKNRMDRLSLSMREIEPLLKSGTAVLKCDLHMDSVDMNSVKMAMLKTMKRRLAELEKEFADLK